MSDVVELQSARAWKLPQILSLLARAVGLCLLLIAELIYLTVRFDSGSLSQDGGWMSVLANQVPVIPQVIAVIFTASLIFGANEFGQTFSRVRLELSQHRTWPLWLVIHICCYMAFVFATHMYFEVDRGSSGFGLVLWLLVAMVTFVTWLGSLVPFAVCRRELATLGVPIAIGAAVGVLAWLAGQASIGAWTSLSRWTFQCVAILLQLAGIPVVQDPSQFILGTASFDVQIAPECSGYEGMGLAVVFVSTYLWWRRSEHLFPRSLLLIPMAIGLMFAANVLRLALLIWIGHIGFDEFALGGFHSQAGWLAFNVVALCLVFYARSSHFFRRENAISDDLTDASENRTLESVPMLAPFVVLTITLMVTGSVQLEFDWLYPLRFLAVSLAFACFWNRYRPEHWNYRMDWFGPSVGVAVYAMWIWLEPPANSTVVNESFAQAQAIGGGWFFGWLVFRVLGSVVTVPLAEEFAFRGYLQPWLATQFSKSATGMPVVALVVSSLAFGALHPGRIMAGTLAGMLYGWVYYRRGRLMDAVVAHATTNGLIALQVLACSQWSLWN